MKPPGIMATRQALVGKQVELLRDVRTRGGTKFLAGEMLRVNSVCRGRTPLFVPRRTGGGFGFLNGT